MQKFDELFPREAGPDPKYIVARTGIPTELTELFPLLKILELMSHWSRNTARIIEDLEADRPYWRTATLRAMMRVVTQTMKASTANDQYLVLETQRRILQTMLDEYQERSERTLRN